MPLTEYDFHPAANVFPMMGKDEFSSLVQDIREHGVRESIVLFQGKLIDGRNRYKAMRELGIDPGDHAAEMETCDDPIAFVLSLNLHRRHLNETQRATVAAKIANMKEGKPSKDTSSNDLVSQQTAAQMLNVSTPSVKRAKHAIEKGASDVVAAMESGELPASVAAKFVDAVPDKKEQAKIAKQGVEAVKAAVKPNKPETEPTPRKESPLEKKGESNYFARFKALWNECDAIARAAIVTFVNDYGN